MHANDNDIAWAHITKLMHETNRCIKQVDDLTVTQENFNRDLEAAIQRLRREYDNA